MALRRTFVLDAATSVYADPHRCPSRGFECFFQRASNCTAADVLSDLPPAATEPNTSAAVQLAARLDELPRVSLGADVPPRVLSGRASCTSKLTRSEIEARLSLYMLRIIWLYACSLPSSLSLLPLRESARHSRARRRRTWAGMCALRQLTLAVQMH